MTHVGGVEGSGPPDGGLSHRSLVCPLPRTLLPVVAADGTLVSAVANALRGQRALQTKGAVTAFRRLPVQAPQPHQVGGQGVGPGAVVRGGSPSVELTIVTAHVQVLARAEGSVLLFAVLTAQVTGEDLLDRGGHGGLCQDSPEIKHIDGVGVDVHGRGGWALSGAHRLDRCRHAHALTGRFRSHHLPELVATPARAGPLRASLVQAPRPKRADVRREVAGALLPVSVGATVRRREVKGMRAAVAVGGVVPQRLPLGLSGAARGRVLLGMPLEVEDRGPGRPLLDVGSFRSLEVAPPLGAAAAAAGLLGGLSQDQSQLACRTHRGRVRRENRH